MTFVVELIAATVVVMDHPDRRDAPAAPAHLVAGDRTVRLINLGGPAAEHVLAGVAAEIGAAVRHVDAFWGVDWSPEITVVAAGSDEQFRAEAGGGPAAQWADIAAVTLADRVDAERHMALRQRIVFAPGAARMSTDSLRIVLTHELFHYAARAGTAADAPQWLTEGVADFVARPATRLPPDAGAAAQGLPSDADLDTPGPQRSSAYDRAWWFARFVADTFGTAKLRAFYVATCGVGHTDVSTAARDVLGVDTAGLLAGWRRWLTR